MAIPLLGTIAFGAQRMLPTVQTIFYSWSNLNGSRGSLIDVVKLLNYPINNELRDKVNRLEFKKSIELVNLSFA